MSKAALQFTQLPHLPRIALVIAGAAALTFVGVSLNPLTGFAVLDLSAGFALVVLMRWGPWLTIPTGLGVVLGWQLWFVDHDCAGTALCATWVDAVILGFASMVRAWLGWRWTGALAATVPALNEPSEIARFFVRGALLPSVVAAAVAIVGGTSFGALHAGLVWQIGLAHWASSVFGILIGSTLFWSWWGEPGADWASRRWPLTLVSLVGTALILMVAALVARAEHRRDAAELDRAAVYSSNQLRAQMDGALHAIRAVSSLFTSGREVTREEFRDAAEAWLEPPSQLQALGWSEIIGTAELPRFEARAHAEGFSGLRVMSADGRGGLRSVRPDEPLAVIRFVEPLAQNRLAPGINSRANPMAAAAIERALAGHGVSATSSFPLLLPAAFGAPESGVVLYRAVSASRAPASDDAKARGLVFATIRVSQMWQAVLASRPAGVVLCLFEPRGSDSVVLAAEPGCPTRLPMYPAVSELPPDGDLAAKAGQASRGVGLTTIRSVTLADRRWVLLATDAGQTVRRLNWTVTLVALAGFAGVGLVIALLLVITGRARRIERAVAEAQVAREMADEANRAKTRFLSHMSHDLRTPLNAVLGFAQLMETDNSAQVPISYKQWARKIRHAGEYLLEMVGDILDLARIESGSIRLDIRPLDAGRVLDEAVPLVAGAAATRGIRLAVMHDAGGEAILGDPTRVRQILVNLLSNAVKYNRDQGWIEISTQRLSGSVRISVRDGGLGMSAEQVGRLFHPFDRLGREASSIEGTGIGLVICQRLAHAMRGDIEVESRPDQGSTFALVLPAGPELAQAMTASDLPHSREIVQHMTATVPPAGHGTEQALRVHYIEDDPVNQEIMRAMLGRYGAVTLDCSSTGADALRSLRRSPQAIDLIILDVNLPDFDGIELLKILRSESGATRTPVIVLSADVTPENHFRAKAAGADACLAKPVDLDALLAMVHRFDARSGSSHLDRD